MTEAPPTDRVVIAVDPHKASWTAAAVDASLQPLDIIRVPARRWTNLGWAVDGRGRTGGPLTQRLTADGCGRARQTRARVRVLSTGHGRKTDEADAVSVGIAALTATRLNTASVEQRSSPCAPGGTMTTRGVSHPLLSLPSVGRKWAAPRRGADRGRVWLIATSYGPGTGGSGSCAPPTHIQTRESKWHRIDTHSGRHFCTSKIGHSGP